MLNKKSLDILSKVNQNLASVMRIGIGYQVIEGLRTIEKQAEYVKSGASKTMDSRHLTGEAVDIACFSPEGIYHKELKPYIKAAQSVQAAAKTLKVSVTWGAIWDTPLNLIDHPVTEADINAYRERQKARNVKSGRPDKRILIDGPHFELTKVK